jgi:signal transduction histidine kinase
VKTGIRHRLLTIVVLGVVTSALSIGSLAQLLTTSTSQRIERARDAVSEEVHRVAQDPARLSEPGAVQLVGMHAGMWDDVSSPSALPPAWGDLVREAVTEAHAGDRRVVRDRTAADGTGTVLVAAEPANEPRGRTVFAVYAVKPLASLRTWQWIVALLTGATALLVATALYSVVGVGRGAAALRRALDALASDLRTPVPRSNVRELDGIAEGIAVLSKKLADARDKEERLARELADNERLAALGRVVAGVAHEVRNPLASIKLRLDLAARAAKLPDEAASGITHATNEIDRLDRLVRDLLFVSGRSVGPKGRSDVAALVRARADALAPWADERGVRVEVSGDGSAAIDGDAMARAVDNMLRNAVEASPRGATVRATIVAEETRVVLDVDDEGAGVPPERAAELFEPFFTTKPSGTGLGLAISRAIARAHGGDVTYARAGDVTRFTLAVAESAISKEAA